MLGNISAAGSQTVGTQQMQNTIVTPKQVDEEFFAARAGHGGRILYIQNEPRNDFRDVIGIPIAIYKRFAKTNVAKKHAALKKTFADNADVGGNLCVRGADKFHRAVRQFEVQTAECHFL